MVDGGGKREVNNVKGETSAVTNLPIAGIGLSDEVHTYECIFKSFRTDARHEIECNRNENRGTDIWTMEIYRINPIKHMGGHERVSARQMDSPLPLSTPWTVVFENTVRQIGGILIARLDYAYASFTVNRC